MIETLNLFEVPDRLVQPAQPTGSTIHLGDCLEVMKGLPDCSVDSIVTDPPYALEFMGAGWDSVLPPVEVWKECLRVAKPGAMLLAFGGTRTYHRLTCSIEDAGWQIRDCIMWVYGSGFPKSYNISKAIDKKAGAEREVIGTMKAKLPTSNGKFATDKWSVEAGKFHDIDVTAPATDLAKRWDGWGTALKPAWESIVVAMKPLDGTFANNAEKHGVAGLNIEGCRVGTETITSVPTKASNTVMYAQDEFTKNNPIGEKKTSVGRWPSNLIHDGSEEATAGMGEKARYYYCAKASRAERNAGCGALEEKRVDTDFRQGGLANPRDSGKYAVMHNSHPTIKPLALMRYLVRLTATPTGGIVLDPYCGSGTTGVACKSEGREFVGIEMEPEYFEIAKARTGAGE